MKEEEQVQEPTPEQPKSAGVSQRVLEKFDAQKKVLQRYVIHQLNEGETAGLSADQVQLLRVGLEVLGWLPKDVKV